MAFNIVYTYKLIDKFSLPLRKINKVNTQFRAGMKKSAEATKGLAAKMLSARKASEKLTSATRVNANSMREVAQEMTTAKQKADQVARAVDKVEKKTRKAARTTGLYTRMMRGASKVSGRFASRLSSLQGIAGGVAAAIGGRVALSKFISFDAAMNKLESVTFAGRKAMEGMRSTAKRLGAVTQFTAAQAAQGMTFLGMAGFDTVKIMAAIPGVLQLAAAAGLDLGVAADIATNVLGQMGFAVTELARVNDVMALAQSRANFSITELFEAMRPVAPTAKNLGISLEQLTALLGAMANAGEKGSIAGTLLRNALTKLAGASKSQRKIYKQLGIDLGQFLDKAGKIKNITGFIGKLSALQKQGKLTIPILQRLFGERGFRAIQLLAGAGAESIEKFELALKKAAGSAQKAATIQMKGLPGVLKTLTSAFEALIIAIFETGIADVLIKSGNAMTAFLRTVSKANPVLVKILGIIGLIAIIVAPALIAVGVLAAIFSSLAGVLASPLLVPILVALAVIGALTSMIAKAAAKSAFFKEALGFLGASLVPMFSAFKKFFVLLGLANNQMSAGKVFVTVLGVAFIALGAIIKTLFAPINFVLTKVTAIVDAIRTAQSIGGKIGGAFKALFSFGDPETAAAPASASAQEVNVKNRLDVSMQVSAAEGSRVDAINTNLRTPGNLGVNIAGVSP